jgi:type I restriction enzyme, S subunit
LNDDVPMVKLSEIATDMYRGSGIKRNEVTDDGTPCVRYGEIYTTYNIWFDTCVSHTYKGKKTFEHGDILFTITGESVEEIAKSCAYMGHEKCFAGGDIVVMKHKQNPKYIAYALSTSDAQAQKSKGKVKSKVVHSSIPALKDIQIPLPPLNEQARIVSILDRFDELTTNMTHGLPAEIEARQKQYEYYRDRLLTFKEVSA